MATTPLTKSSNSNKSPKGVVHKSRIDLGDNVRKQSIEALNNSLASLIDLQMRTKEAHWNIRGKSFIGVHLFLDTLYGVVGEHVDTVAERITSLGGQAEGRLPQVTQRTQLGDYPTETLIEDHLTTLADSFAICGKDCRENIDKTDDAGDKGTADMYTEVSRDLDKYLWMIEAHINVDGPRA